MKKIIYILVLLFLILINLKGITSVSANTEIDEYIDSYSQTGLVSLYSGTYNTKSGHNEKSSTWDNLVGDTSLTLTTDNDNKFNDDSFHLKSVKEYFSDLEKNTVNGNEFTLEFIVSNLKSLGKDFNTLINSSNDNFALFRRVSTDVLEFKFAGVSQINRPTVGNSLEILNEALISITYKVNGKVRIYINGILKAEKDCTNQMGANDLYFGHSDASRNFEAFFKVFRFYNRELTNDEIIYNAKADELYDNNEDIYNNVNYEGTNIIGGINAIRRINSKEELETMMVGSNLPQAVIYEIDSYLNINLSDTSDFSIDDSLEITHNNVIPVFEITDEKTSDVLVSYLKKNKLYDCFVLSTDSKLIKYTREKLPYIYGVIDYSDNLKDKDVLTKEDLINIRKSMHEYYGTIAIIPVNLCSHENMQYLYDSIVNVWAEVLNYSESDLTQGILSGAIGVITDYTGVLFDIANNDFDTNSMTRLSLNIAHRGLPVVAPENTIEGARLAYMNGADSIELDIYLTTDNQIVVMHDSTTGRTCNKNLTVENSSLKELKELYVNKGFENDEEYKNCKIPTLEEYLEEFKNKDVRLFIEVKSNKDAIIPLTKALIDKYNMYDQISFISFSSSQIDNLNNIYAESTTGLLLYGILDEVNSQNDMLNVMKTIGKYNSTLNPNKAGYGKNAIITSLSRGISIYPWTFNNKEEYIEYFLNGYSGLTGNDCRILAKFAKKLEVSYTNKDYYVGDTITFDVNSIRYNRESYNINDKITVRIVDYNRNDTIDSNKVTFRKKGKVNLVISYQYQIDLENYYTIYSDVISINVLEKSAEETVVTNEEKGCASIININMIILLIPLSQVLFICKKNNFY